MADEHVTLALVAYLDGELAPAERQRVEVHLATCAECMAQLEALRVLQRDVGLTLEAALSPLRLSRDADARIRQAIRARAERPSLRLSPLWARRGLLANLGLLLVLVAFGLGFVRTLSLPAPAGAQETIVLGASRMAPGSQAALRVIVRSAEAALPMAGAEVVVSLVGSSGAVRELYRGITDAAGTSDVRFAVPPDMAGAAQLVVETRSELGAGRIVRPIAITRSYKVYLTSDRPAYRPGDLVQARVLALDAQTLKPVTGAEIELVLQDAEGAPLVRQSRELSEYGIASVEFALPADASEGSYSLVAELGDTRSARSLAVTRYTLPDFRVLLETDRNYYAPGNVVQVTLEADYWFDRPVVGGRVLLRGFGAGDRLLFQSEGVTDSQGRTVLEVGVPASLAGTSMALEAEVADDAGHLARLRRTVPISKASLIVTAMPESGVLKPGVENAVYLAVAYPDGEGAAAELVVDLQRQRYLLETGPQGLATLWFVPESATVVMEVTARDSYGAELATTVKLGSDQAERAILLRAESARYTVGETLQLEVLSNLADGVVVYLDVERAGQMVAGYAASLVGGRAAFALDLDAGLVGTLTLRAYVLPPGEKRIEDARLVVVDQAESALDVSITSDQSVYAPGETAAIEIATTDSAGRPQPAALGLAVVDESVLALDLLPVGFARAYILLERELLDRALTAPGLEVDSLVSGARTHSEMEKAQDLAARAAWAELSIPKRTIDARGLAAHPDPSLAAWDLLGRWLSMWVIVLLTVLVAVVVLGLRAAAVTRMVLRRLAWGLLALVVLSPVLILGVLIGQLLPALGAALAVGVLALVVVLLAALWVASWFQRLPRAQVLGGLVFAYLISAGSLLYLAAGGMELASPLIWVLVGGHLLGTATLAAFGQGLVVVGRRGAGWGWTVLALLLVVLTATLGGVPQLSSPLSQRLSHPGLYAGPLGWLSGCSPMATSTPASPPPMEAEAVVGATATAVAEPTAVSPAVPVEPYPLRQLFPETLYWMPETETDALGRLQLDLPLADSLTTWRLSVLASTADGALGAATHSLIVQKAFFVDAGNPPAEILVGEPVTLTLTIYSELPSTSKVLWEVTTGAEVLSMPGPVWVQPGQTTAVTLVVRPDQPGPMQLEISALAGAVVDRIALTLQVQE